MDCVLKAKQPMTNNPDWLVCGEFQGYTDLEKNKGQVVATGENGKVTVRKDISLYPNPLFTKESQKLGNCYYDFKSPELTGPISIAVLAAEQEKLVNLYASMDSQLPQCANKKSISAVCAAWITCRGENSRFHACMPSGPASCLPAEECLTDNTLVSKQDVTASQDSANLESSGQKATSTPYYPSGDVFRPWTIRNPAGQTTSFALVRKYEKDNLDGTSGWFTRSVGCAADMVQDAGACFNDPCVKGIPASLRSYGVPASNGGASNASQPK